MDVATPIILTGLFIVGLITARAVERLPLKEFRLRSRAGQDGGASALYRLAQYGTAARAFLWLVTGLSLAGLSLIAFDLNWWAGMLAVLLGAGLAGSWRPVRETRGWAWQIASIFAIFVAKIFSLLKPLPDQLNELIGQKQKIERPEAIYEKDDLLALLQAQKDQPDNRIDGRDLQRAAHSLTLNDRTIGQVMAPRREVPFILSSEPIGPAVMDELHKTGQQRFPVVKSVAKSSSPDVIGSLYIGDLLNHLGDKGKVGDLINPSIGYINEAESLEQALDACLKTGSQLLIVVDGRAEVVGTLALETILEQAIGQLQVDDFDGYHDARRAADHEPVDIGGQQ